MDSLVEECEEETYITYLKTNEITMACEFAWNCMCLRDEKCIFCVSERERERGRMCMCI